MHGLFELPLAFAKRVRLFRSKWLCVTVAVGVLLSAKAAWATPSAPNERTAIAETIREPHYPIRRSLGYQLAVKNDTGSVLKDVLVWTLVPLGNTGNQRVTRISASLPHELEQMAQGSQRILTRLAVVPPYSSRTISVRLEMEFALTPNRLAKREEVQSFLGAQSKIEIDHPAIRELAETLRDLEPIETARAIFDWVAANVRYARYIRDARGALFALTEREGDCTEYATLFAALARANGIPARVVGGFVVEQDAVLRARSFHNWAEFFIDGAWYLADAQRRVFASDNQKYAAFHIYSFLEQTDLIGNARFGVSDSRLSIRME